MEFDARCETCRAMLWPMMPDVKHVGPLWPMMPDVKYVGPCYGL